MRTKYRIITLKVINGLQYKNSIPKIVVDKLKVKYSFFFCQAWKLAMENSVLV